MSSHDILIIGIENWTTGRRPDGIDNDDIRNGDLIREALPTQYRGDYDHVKQWADNNNVSLD